MSTEPVSVAILIAHLCGDYLLQNDWMATNKKSHTWPCAVHVTLYTSTVWVFTGWPTWALAVVWFTHFMQDRTPIVSWWMNLIGQRGFMQPPLAPWSLIVVDNTWHLLTLYLIGVFAR